MRKEDVLTEEYKGTSFFSSYKDKYIVMDNLSGDKDACIHKKSTIYNNQYTCIIVVLQGTMNLRLTGESVELKENDFIAIMPGVKIYIDESECRYFSFMTLPHIVNDIYIDLTLPYSTRNNFFCYHHHHFSQDHIDILYSCYRKMKREHVRPDYHMKEQFLRTLVTIYLTHLHSFVDDEQEIIHYKNSHKHMLLHSFLDEINMHYTRERSVLFYSNRLKISSKYLSTITRTLVDESASNVIDLYVTYRIKQLLYSGEYNVNEICQRLHFPTLSFFGRFFKRMTGMSPRQYLTSNNKKVV